MKRILTQVAVQKHLCQLRLAATNLKRVRSKSVKIIRRTSTKQLNPRL